MKPRRTAFGCLFVFSALALSLTVACEVNDVPLGSQGRLDGGVGSGGMLGTGGAVGRGGSQGDAARGGAGGGSAADVALATGGNVGTGGATGMPGTGGMSRDGGSVGGSVGTGGGGGSGGSAGSSQTGSGGKTGTGGSTGSGGKTGTGGSTGSGGKTGTGGSTSTGGKTGTGGSTSSGGKTGTGGTGGSGGSTGAGEGDPCGGSSWRMCAPGLLCDLASDCGRLANATGTCVATGVPCLGNVVPVCGCDGKTYSNDCVLRSAGMPKASDGACPTNDGGAVTYPAAYLSWQMPGGVGGIGPAVVVSQGSAYVWQRVSGFSPESLPPNPTKTVELTSAQADDLFARLAAVNVSSLPHDNSSGFFECYPRLYFKLCEGCAETSLRYDYPQNLAPEMDPVWLWFEQVFPDVAYAQPRHYCEPF